MKPAITARGRPPVPGAAGRTETLARPLLIAMIVAAMLTPGIRLSGSLPDVRIEQLLALPALILLMRAGALPTPAWPGNGSRLSKHAHHSPALRPGSAGMLDAALLLVGLATIISTVAAPLLLQEPLSPRDLYEVLKLALYWTLFRFALTTAREPATRRAAIGALVVAGGASALIGLVQYLDPSGFGQRIGDIWAPAHHLQVLARDGRAFGTVGNPNYFGALMAILALVSMIHLTRCGAYRYLALGGCMLGAIGVVLSGSRGALAMLLAGLVAGVCTLLVYRRLPKKNGGGTFSSGPAQPTWSGWRIWQRRQAIRRSSGNPARAAPRGAAVVLAALAVSVVFVEAVPRGRQSYLARVAGAFTPGGDSSLALRLERWRAAFGLPGASGSSDVPGAPLTDTGRPSAGPDARARDTQIRSDVGLLVDAVRRHRTANGSLPADLAVLNPPPVPDVTPYRLVQTDTGFVIIAPVADPAAPDYPMFAAGEGGNYLFDGNVEGGGSFRALPGTDARRAQEAALYGGSGLVFSGNADASARRAAVYQQRSFNRAGRGQFTAAVWVKLPRPVQGEVFLYTNVLYTDGARADPYARVAADGAAVGIWQRLSLTITPDPARRIDFIGVYLLSDSFAGEAWADGFQLVDGPVPRTFTGLPEVEVTISGTDAGAQFRRSPIIGVGPGKATGGATLDNEYLLVLSRYGLLGLAAYLGIWAALGLLALRHIRAGNTNAAALAGIIAGLLVFNLVAGSLYHLQLMGVFWPLAGVLLSWQPPDDGFDKASGRDA